MTHIFGNGYLTHFFGPIGEGGPTGMKPLFQKDQFCESVNPAVSWHSTACQNMSCNCWCVPPCPTIISKSCYAPVRPSMSLYLDFRPVCTNIASLGVHMIELRQPSSSTVSTNPEDCVPKSNLAERPVISAECHSFLYSI